MIFDDIADSGVVEVAHAELVDPEKFFAPVSTDLIARLVAEYQGERALAVQVAEFFETPGRTKLLFNFFEGASGSKHGVHSEVRSYLGRLNLEFAIKALDSEYWQKAIDLTDVYQQMPEARRKEWRESIEQYKVPEFLEDTVRDTITELMLSRPKFLAERVDGVFRGLSGEHVTNRPEGFYKRMIISRALNEWGSSNLYQCGLINDLRCVIAKFNGQDEVPYNSSYQIVNNLYKRKTGEWVELDGGALRLKVFKKGTAHLEVHPDMAWRLNCILASLYPLAIPASFRARPVRQAKTFKLIDKPLPREVLTALSGLRVERMELFMSDSYYPVSIGYSSGSSDPNIRAMMEDVLRSIGGIESKGRFYFGYEPSDAIDEIVRRGTLPEHVSHQFYPTPAFLAERVAELAGVESGMRVLEPSAGIGSLLDAVKSSVDAESIQIDAVEVSRLHAKILNSKGYEAVCSDFIEWAPKQDQRYDRIVMNPPFSGGRWLAHVQTAAGLLKTGGRLVAILPSGAQNRLSVERCNLTFDGPFHNAFDKAGVSVVIATVTRV